MVGGRRVGAVCGLDTADGLGWSLRVRITHPGGVSSPYLLHNTYKRTYKNIVDKKVYICIQVQIQEFAKQQPTSLHVADKILQCTKNEAYSL